MVIEVWVLEINRVMVIFFVVFEVFMNGVISWDVFEDVVLCELFFIGEVLFFVMVNDMG